MKFSKHKPLLVGTSVGIFLIGGYFGLSFIPGATYSAETEMPALAGGASSTSSDAVKTQNSISPEEKIIATHVNTPVPMRGIYMTACVAGTPSWRTKLMSMIDSTELNSLVIDIKDYSGTISFHPSDPVLKENTGSGCRAKDMQKFVAELHDRGIYVIGRITVFQDPYYTKTHPELAVKRLSDGGVWKDRKGLSFIDVGAKPYWDYIIALSRESYSIGFDELNFDYIRFPSDGDMKDIDFTLSRGKTKAEALREFFSYLNEQLRGSGAKLSADLFGMTTTNTDDLNIGQVLENTLPYFDYIYPMVYPSHYPTGFNGWRDVNAHSYDIVKFSLDRAVARTEATTTTIRLFDSVKLSPATGTKSAIYSKTAYNRSKIRPWLQDFDYPVPYTPDMVKAQIKATYDAGLDSWILWDPANKYTPSVLNPS